MTKLAFVLSNDPGRKKCQTSRLTSAGPIYGYDAVFRDTKTDAVVLTNYTVAKDAFDAQIQEHAHVYTFDSIWVTYGRPERARAYPAVDYIDSPETWLPEALAAQLACTEQADVVALVGFDFYSTSPQDNLYANMYKPAGQEYTVLQRNNLISQLHAVIANNPSTSFVFIHDEVEPPAELDDLENWTADTYANLYSFVSGFSADS